MSDSFSVIFGMALDTWPIPEAAVLISESVSDVQLLFIGLPDGSFGIRVIRNGTNEDYESDVVVPAGEFKIVASIIYSPHSPRVQLNGSELICAAVGSRQKETFHLKAPLTRSTQEHKPPPSVIPQHATDAEALFIRTIGDLDQVSTSNDWHVLLKSSAALRLLLLDGLLNKANERRRLKISFTVADNSVPPHIVFDKRWQDIAPHDTPLEHLISVSLDQLLKFKVYESKDSAISVRDVIRAAANADGGVHFGSPGSLEEELVLNLDKQAFRFGQAASRHILKDICKVVVAGSIPLIEKIQSGQTSA
jgi:hypothetical protein